MYFNIDAEKPFSGMLNKVYVCMYVCVYVCVCVCVCVVTNRRKKRQFFGTRENEPYYNSGQKFLVHCFQFLTRTLEFLIVIETLTR